MFVSLFTKIYSTVLVQIKFEKEILKPSPHKGLEPLTVGLKVQRSTDCASRALLQSRAYRFLTQNAFELDLSRLCFFSVFTKKISNKNKKFISKSSLKPLIVGLKTQLSTESASSKELSRIFFATNKANFWFFIASKLKIVFALDLIELCLFHFLQNTILKF